MASVSSQSSDNSVSVGLMPFRGRANRLTIGRTTLLGAIALLVGLIAAMWLDLILPMPMSARWVVTRLGLVFGAAAIAGLSFWQIRRLTTESLALWIDDRASTGGETLAGWQLEQSPPPESAAVSRALAAMAAARASRGLRGIAPEKVLPTAPLRKAIWMLCGSLFVVGLLALVIPGVAWNQWQRFAFPARDVPPYTGITIELDPSELSAVYGSDVSLQASVTAGRADFLELVTRTSDGREHVLPMLQQADRQWQAILSRVTEPLEFYARSGRSRSRLGKLDVQMTPRILASKVRITPPAYTKRLAYEGAIPKDGVTGLAGTRVEFTVASNRPLRDGRLELAYRDGDAEQVSLKPIKPTAEAAAGASANDKLDADTVSGSIALAKPGTFAISVFDTGGLESHDRVTGTITITADQRPVVRILEPKPLSIATPDIRLPLAIAAEDDFGVSRLELYIGVNESKPESLALDVDGNPSQNTQLDLPLDGLGLAPGDEIKLFARAEDNDPSAPKGAESPVTTVRIISTSEFQELALREQGAESIAAKYEQAQRYLEHALDALREAQAASDAADQHPNADQAFAELQSKLDAAEKAAAEAAENMEKLAAEPLPIDVDRELARRLGEMAQQTNDAAAQLGQMSSSQAGSRPLSDEEKQTLETIAQQMGDQRKNLESEAVEPLEKMQQALPLIMDQQRFVEIAKQQKDLADRLESLRDAKNDDPQTIRRVAEFEAEQQQLRESLNSLLDDIASQAAALPDVPEFEKLKTTAESFAGELRDSQAIPSMSSTQQNLLGSNFPAAGEDARRAADILSSFVKKCDSMGGAACESCQMAFNPSTGGPALGDSIKQMLDMMGTTAGLKSGNTSGMGMGVGAGGGYATRQPGPHNMGMYGSLPTSMARSSRGRGDRTSRGVATSASGAPQQAGAGGATERAPGNAEGQAASNVPPAYRAQVAEYFRQLAEQLGEQ